MAPTRFAHLLALAAVAFALITAVLQVRQAGGSATSSPPVVSVVMTAGLAAAVLVVAWPVRRWNAGERDRPLNPLRAARTLALAKAAAMAGAVLTGGWVGYVGVALPVVAVTTQPGRTAASAAVVLASLGLMVAGLVAERWCVIPPGNGAGGGHGGRVGEGHAGPEPSPA